MYIMLCVMNGKITNYRSDQIWLTLKFNLIMTMLFSSIKVLTVAGMGDTFITRQRIKKSIVINKYLIMSVVLPNGIVLLSPSSPL